MYRHRPPSLFSLSLLKPLLFFLLGFLAAFHLKLTANLKAMPIEQPLPPPSPLPSPSPLPRPHFTATLHTHTGKHDMFTKPLAKALAMVNISVTAITKNVSIPPYMHMLYLQRHLSKRRPHKWLLDFADNAYAFEPRWLDWSDHYFKSSLNWDFFNWASPKAVDARYYGGLNDEIQRGYLKLVKSGKVHPIPLLRGEFDMTRPLNTATAKSPRKFILSTLSYHVTSKNTGEARLRLYRMVRDRYRNESRFQFHVIMPDSGWQIMQSSFLKGKDIHTHEAITSMIKNSWFWLNLSGMMFSQSTRLEMVCAHGAAVVSDYIYPAWAKKFPVFPLSMDSQGTEFDERRIIHELDYLVGHYQEVYQELWKTQRTWCATLFHPAYWVHHLLRHVPGQPYAPFLTDEAASDYYYHRSPSASLDI